MLLLALAFIFIVIAVTRPGRGRLFRGRYRRNRQPTGYAPLRPIRTHRADPTAGLRDPARPF